MKTKRIQRCSKCKQIGHNSSNKMCPSNVDLSDFIEDAEDEEGDTSADETMESEEVVDIDDLLYSDDELF